jgi:bifunctional DNA-binding transcriptional regulator/antitoxin component of YhaV-PrlF toxin-antitoxin module
MSMIVTSDFQVTIPLEIRERMGLKPGDKVAFVGHPKTPSFVRVPTLDKMIDTMKGSDINGYRDEEDRF